MRINIGKLPKAMFDEHGNSYDPIKLIPTGKTVDWHKKHNGWQYIVGKYLIRVVL